MGQFEKFVNWYLNTVILPKGGPMKPYLSLFVVLFVTLPSFAEKVQFPDEELARESVLPVFDRNVSVMNRNVNTAGKTEVGIFGGMNLKEAFYAPMLLGFGATYHMNEVHGVNVKFLSFLGGNSTYADELQDKYSWDFQFLPKPEYAALGHYQYTMYYGKMSLTKSMVFNLSLYGMLGGGIIGFSGTALPNLSAGFGQKFYLTPNSAIRADLRLLSFQGPDIVSRRVDNLDSQMAVSDFDKKLLFYTVMTVGYVYMF